MISSVRNSAGSAKSNMLQVLLAALAMLSVVVAVPTTCNSCASCGSAKDILVTGTVGNFSTGCSASITSITFGAGVTTIPANAFKNFAGVTSVDLGQVVTVGSSAFQACGALATLTLPSTLVTIQDSAFSTCSSLSVVTIPSSVTTIGANAFAGCILQDIAIPSTVTSLDFSAFSGMQNTVKTVRIGDGVTGTLTDAFSGAKLLTDLSIGNGITAIAASAFAGCTSLVNIAWGPIQTIGDSAFARCTAITSITLPSTVTSIGTYSFTECTSLTVINLSSALTSIGNSAFSGSAIIELDLPSTVTPFSADIFSGMGGALQILKIGDGVTGPIPSGTFQGFNALTSVTIGNGITSLGTTAFASCGALVTVKLGNAITLIDSTAFGSCPKLTTINIPNSVVTINSNAFVNDVSLLQIDFGTSLKTIGNTAFYGCTSLNTITIPDTTTTIGASAFQGDTSLYCRHWNDAIKRTIGSNAFLYAPLTGCTQPPTMVPTPLPSAVPSAMPSHAPTQPTQSPTPLPTQPTSKPSQQPTRPTCAPSAAPSAAPSMQPTTAVPSAVPSMVPTQKPTVTDITVTASTSLWLFGADTTATRLRQRMLTTNYGAYVLSAAADKELVHELAVQLGMNETDITITGEQNVAASGYVAVDLLLDAKPSHYPNAVFSGDSNSLESQVFALIKEGLNTTVSSGALLTSIQASTSGQLKPVTKVEMQPVTDVTPHTDSNGGSSDNGLSTGDLIAIIVCSVVGGLILIALLVYCCAYRGKSYDHPNTANPNVAANPGTVVARDGATRV